MSGHSKWSTIKRKKGVADAARGKVFTRLALAITGAAKKGGPDPTANATLRVAIEKARAENVPKESIAKAIRRGGGHAGDDGLENFSYDAVGPGGVALIIEGATDNKNRTLSEIRLLLSRNNAKLAEGGSQRWRFKKSGFIDVSLSGLDDCQKDKAELDLIEAGAQDLSRKDSLLRAVTLTEDQGDVLEKIKKQGYVVTGSGVKTVASDKVSLGEADREKVQGLIGQLEEQQDVRLVVNNLA